LLIVKTRHEVKNSVAMTNWSRTEKIGLCALLVAITGVIVTSLTVPEFRGVLGLNRNRGAEIPAGALSANSSPSINSVASKPINISIPYDKWSDASWNEYNPNVDPSWSGHAGHAFMRAKGTISYVFTIGRVEGGRATVSAKLSSELLKVGPNNPVVDSAYASDVTLLVNGIEQDTKRVIPDNGIGIDYMWTIPVSVLRSGENKISFMVKNNNLANGLCIYSPIQISVV
jgi:hypothetical protein